MAPRVVPVLRIFDEARARAFYLGFLGFEVVFEHRFEAGLPLYLRVARAGCEIDLSEHHGDGTPGTRVLIYWEGLDALHAELSERDYPFYNPTIETASWGDRILQVIDPFQNVLLFTEPSAGTR